LKENENVATILEIQGIRCSPRMFQIDLEMKQLLILKPVDLFEKCILLKPAKPLEEPKSLPVQPENIQITEAPLPEENLTETILQETQSEPQPQPEPEPEPEPEIEVQLKSPDDLEEIELELDSIESDEKLFLKKRNDVYYKMYKEALKKARVAKELALTSYLEAKHIKNTYMLTDLSDDSDLDEDLEIEN
jgi:hypothetical protein